MPFKLYSPHWDEEFGSCELHGIPMAPCPQCLAEKEKDICVSVNWEMLSLLQLDPNFKVEDCFSEKEQWLLKRIS